MTDTTEHGHHALSGPHDLPRDDTRDAARGRLGRWHVPGAALLSLGLVAGLLTAATALVTATSASAAVYSGSTSVYLTPGRAVEQAGPRETLGFVKVPSPGTYFADLTSRVTDNSSDPVQYVAISLICKEESSIEDQIGAASNIVRGETRVINARVYFSIKKRGACFAYGTTMGLKSSSASLSSRRLLARTTLTISGPVSPATVENKRFVYDDANRGYSGRSFLAKPRVQAHAAELETKAAPGSSALVTGNVYLTSCTSQGGSRDQTTDGKNLCTRAVTDHNPTGPLVNLRLVARQYTPGGRVCATTIVPGSTTRVRISSTRHHLPVAIKGNVTLPDTATCGTRLRVWTEVQVVSGPAVVVHFPSTVTAYRPT